MNLSSSKTLFLTGLSVLAWCVFSPTEVRAAGAVGEPEGGEFQVIEYESGGRVHRWMVAPDEVCVVQPGTTSKVNRVPAIQGGNVLGVFETLADQARAATQTPEATRQLYSLPRQTSPAEYHPVVYPEGKAGQEKYRRVLKPVVNLVLSGPVNLDSLKQASGASAGSWVVGNRAAALEFDSVSEALGALAVLQQIDGVERAYPEVSGRHRVKAIPADPLFNYNETRGYYQWHLRNLGVNGSPAGLDVNITDVWDNYTGDGVVIGIVDDGLSTFHPDLFLNTDRVNDYDFNGDDNNPNPENDPLDGIVDDHGTSVAGVAAASWNNGVGGVGAAPDATLIGLRVLGDIFNMTDADFAAAVGWNAGNIAISNNSWGPGDPTAFAEDPLVVAAMEDGVANARGGLGRIFCFAAGNDGAVFGNTNHSTLTTAPESIAIGAINDAGTKAFYSTPGTCLVISAPSGGSDAQQGITTTTLVSEGSYTSEFSGTSSATPLVAGCIALMLEANPDLGWRDVQEILIESAFKIDPLNPQWFTNAAGFHFNNSYGAGMMDAAAAVSLAETWTNLSPRQSIEIEANYVTATLPPGEDEEEPVQVGTPIPDNGQALEVLIDASNYTKMRLEHAVLNVEIKHASREQLEVTLISPSGTASQLLDNFQPSDPDNTEADVSFDFPLMTVQSWGEEFSGIWRLRIRDTVTGLAGEVTKAKLTAFGTTFDDLPPRELPGLANELRYTMRLNEFTVIPFAGTPEGSIVSFTGGTLPAGLEFLSDPGAGEFLIIGAPTELGEFPIELTVTNGPDSRAFIVVLVVGGPSGSTLAEAIDQTPGSTSSSGTGGPWVVDVDTTFDGSDAAASPVDLDDNFESTLTFNNPSAGVMLFAWKVSSQENNDRLWFYQSGDPIQTWKTFASGERDWGQVAVPVTSGATRWLYRKDGNISAGDDQAWVDQVRVIPQEEYLSSLGTVLGTDQPIRFRGKTYWLQENTVVNGNIENVVRSSFVGNGQHSGLVVDVQGPANVSCEWRVDAAPSDLLYFLVNGYIVAQLEGSPGWAEQSFELPPGNHEVEWRFSKDSSFANGSDSGYLRSITVEPTSGYAGWLGGYFSGSDISNPALVDPTANPDGDAWTNFEEYVFGGNPTVAESGPLPNEPKLVSDGSGGFIYRFDLPIAIDDVTVEMQASTDLNGWADAGIAGTVVGDVLRFDVPVSGPPPRRFFRVLIEAITPTP